jgi:biopolymer transport protein ExbD
MHAENPEASAVIIADRGSRTGDLVEVMDQIKSAGVEGISIAAEKGEG